jgi:3-deoxy-manno-octulosonate cytidylyltransferase (CMP-KDO synthetase)
MEIVSPGRITVLVKLIWTIRRGSSETGSSHPMRVRLDNKTSPLKDEKSELSFILPSEIKTARDARGSSESAFYFAAVAAQDVDHSHLAGHLLRSGLRVESAAEVVLSSHPESIPVCIPARWAARRFPGKLLQPLGDGTVLSHTVDIALRAGIGPVRVLAADARIEAEARRIGVEVIRIDQTCRNGSERIAAALQTGMLGSPMPELVVNLQGDAVGVPPSALAATVAALTSDPGASLATCAVWAPPEEHCGRTTVTVSGGSAVSFSRQPLPPGTAAPNGLLLHLGLYAYRVPELLRVAASEPGLLEKRESLEQLRWLETGRSVALQVLPGLPSRAHAIDRPGDLREPAPLSGWTN